MLSFFFFFLCRCVDIILAMPLTVMATVPHSANALTDLEYAHAGTDRDDIANNLMAGHNRTK